MRYAPRMSFIALVATLPPSLPAAVRSGLAPSAAAALEPLNAAGRAAFGLAASPGARWVDHSTGPGHVRWVRDDVPLAYLTESGGAFTAFDAAGAVLRDAHPSDGASRDLRRAPFPTAPRPPQALAAATLADAYVGQRVLIEDATPGRWVPAVIVCDGTSVQMPDRRTLAASSAAAVLSDAREELLKDRKPHELLRVFRRTAAGGFVLGVPGPHAPDAGASEPAASIGAPSTLEAVAAMPRDGRRVLVRLSEDERGGSWSLVQWA